MRLRKARVPSSEPESPSAATSVVPSLGNGIAVPMPADRTHLLESLRAEALPEAGEDFFVDWSGIRTRITMLPWAPTELAGTTSTALPIPDDGYRSEDVEYAALAQALNTAEGTFRVVEVGAGWAPWVVAGIVIGRRRGLTASGVAVEADPRRCQWALQHAQDNGVSARLVTGTTDGIAAALADSVDDVDMLVVQAAGWHSRTVLQFPQVPEDDMGSAVWTLPGTDVDYRGAHVSHYDVPTVTMDSLLDIGLRTDLMHVDVQGVEFDLLQPTAGVVQDHVRYLAVGTHNRLSEGQLQEFFLSRGWGLIVDEPCRAVFTMTHPTLSGFTVRDGSQLWENPFLREWPPATP